jgi:hypothetical protein
MARKPDLNALKEVNKQTGDDTELESLETIEDRIQANLMNFHGLKVKILQDLIHIYKNRIRYFATEEKIDYIYDFKSYVKHQYGQSQATYYADTNVVQMLAKEKKEDVLEKDISGLIFILQKLAGMKEPQKLLSKIDSLTRDNVEEEIIKVEPKSPDETAEEKLLNDLEVKVEDRQIVAILGEDEKNLEEKVKYLTGVLERLKGTKIKNLKVKKEKKSA